MKEITLLKQACICCFATISLTFFSISKTNAQISTLDSLKQILISFRENIADSSLEHNLWETQMLMGEDSISDTLITRLLGLEDALYNAEALDAKTTARYFLLVTRCLQQLKDSMPLAEALNNQGLLYVSMGLYDKALPSYQQALAIITNSNKTMQDIYIDVLVNLANLYENLGLYEESLSLFSKVMSIEGDSTDEEHLQLHANTLSDMAYLYESTGQIEKALPLYQQALKLMEKNADKDYHIYAICVSNLAGVYETLKQEEKADTLYHLALKIMENAVGKNHHDYAMCLNDLAYLHRKDMNQYEKVESLFLQALAINKKRGEDHPDYATGLNNLASLYRSRANFFKNKRLDKEADSLYKKSELLNFQALSIYKNKYGTNHPAYANSLSQLAVMYTDMALYKKADTLYRQALKIRTQFFSENHAVYIGNVNNLGLVDIFLKDNTKGLDLLTKANELRLRNIAFTISTLSEEEKLRLIATESYKFDFLPSVLLTTKTESNKALNQLYNSQLLLKGMILQSQQNILRHLRNDSNKKAFQVYEQWKFNKRLIGKQLLLRANQRISYLDSLQNITSELEQSLSRISTDFNNLQKSQSITVNEIAKNLIKEHAASIEFMRFQLYNRKWTDSFMYAALMLLPGDSIVKFIPLCEERQLQHLLLFRGFEYIDMSSLSTYRASSNNQPKSANDSLYLVI